MSVKQNQKTGKWYFSCRYTDWQGNRRQKKQEGFTLAREAKAAEQEFLASVSQQCDISFKAMYEKYIADSATRRRPSTMENKTNNFQKAILPYFGELLLTEITPAHVRSWQNEIITKYAPTSQRQLHAQLSALFNFAIKFYGLKNNPAAIAGAIGTTKADCAQIWTLEEFQQVMRYVWDYATRTAYYIFFFGGLRSGELLALTLADWNSAERTLNITKSLTRIKKVNYIDDPKNKQSIRKIKLPAGAAAMLDKYITSLYQPDSETPIFPTLNKGNLIDRLKSAAKRAGVKRIRVHDLRHSHASLLIDLDVNPLAISRRLGHENIQTTFNIYGHLYKNHAEKVAQKLDDIFPK